MLADHRVILPAPQGAAFDAAQYSFFGDLTTTDGDLGDLDGALEVRWDVRLGRSLSLRCAWSPLAI
jgi:hypothetical protein